MAGIRRFGCPAMDVVTGATTTLLAKLGDLLAAEYQLQAASVATSRSFGPSWRASRQRSSGSPRCRLTGSPARLWERELR